MNDQVDINFEVGEAFACPICGEQSSDHLIILEDLDFNEFNLATGNISLSETEFLRKECYCCSCRTAYKFK